MRIAILSYYSGKMNRGVESWAENVKKHSQKDFLINIVSAENIKINSQNWILNRFLILIHVISSFGKWINADVIVPTNGTFQTLICRLSSWVGGKPMVVFGHSGPGADDKWNLWCSPNVFVAFSSVQAEWANKFKLPWTRVIMIPHAVDTKVFKPTLGKKIVDVLCVAANSPDKRVNLVQLATTGLKLRIVGSGQNDQVPFEQMPEVYNQAKVFCFVPKAHEAFGLVYLEAMACNLPIVAPADPVRTEIVGDAGLLVSDMDKLSETIKMALKTKWGNKPRTQAERFSWDKVISLYSDLWLSL